MPSFSGSWFFRVLACLTLFTANTAIVSASEPSAVVRVLSPRLASSLETALRVSPALRAIVHELERSDLIVHVQGMGLDSRVPLSGALRFVHATRGRRFLRITVDERLSDDDRAAALAHEFHHALEVAASRSVIDRATFAALYKRIGYQSAAGPHGLCYETDGARRAGAAVLAELRTARATARRTDRRASDTSVFHERQR